jgi:PadR family transcriptional regulator, regulatory protein AphA
VSLDHAILGFLSYGPASGYDLKRMFDGSVRHFWPADQSQIYRTLARLAERGWAEVEVIEQETRPDRRVYRQTEAGSEELRRWLLSPAAGPATRSAELVQVFFAAGLDDAEAIGVLRRMAERSAAALRELAEVEAECGAEGPWARLSEREGRFAVLTLEYGMHITQAQLDWLNEVIDRLERETRAKGAQL